MTARGKICPDKIVEIIALYLYQAISDLMRLWAETDSAEDLIKSFMRRRLAADFKIDRVGIFTWPASGSEPRFLIGIGEDPHVCDTSSLFLIRSGEAKVMPTKGLGYDLFVRAGDLFFGFDDTRKGRRFTRNDVAILTQVSEALTKVMMAKFDAVAAKSLAVRDPLTGLLNRRGAEELIAGLVARKAAHCVGIADIDHFKAVNDTHGHEIGDWIIKTVAAIVDAEAREAGGWAARWGGEEFLIVLPADRAGRFNTIRTAVAGDRSVAAGDRPVTVTVSVGYARWNDGPHEEIVRRADAALYAAKEGGRDRVIEG